MIRISRLLRPTLQKKLTFRAGLPNWDRPDPPPTAKVTNNQELSDTDILFTFFDGSMPEFVITQPEIYEGDSFAEYGPIFLKGWGLLFAVVTVFGFSWKLTGITREEGFVLEQMNTIYNQSKEKVEERRWLNWGKKNPFGIELSADYFPHIVKGKVQIPPAFVQQKKIYDNKQKFIAEADSYIAKLKEKCRQEVQEGKYTHH